MERERESEVTVFKTENNLKDSHRWQTEQRDRRAETDRER
jgi:hypothetical protein